MSYEPPTPPAELPTEIVTTLTSCVQTKSSTSHVTPKSSRGPP